MGAKRLQIDEIRAAQDTICNEKASVEKQNKLLQNQLNDINRKCEEHHLTLADFENAKKKKHLDAVAEMSEQIEQLNKMKQKIEKEKHAKRLQIDEIRAAQDTIC